MYQLEKLSVDKGSYSAVRAGYRQSSEHVHVYLANVHPTKEIDDINKIEVGWQVLVGKGFSHLNTSPIKEILEKGENYIRFKTQTSIYELRKVTDG